MNREAVRQAASGLEEQLIRWRRDFHRHPELGLDCHRTAARVAEVLEVLGCRVRSGLAGSGLVASLGQGSPAVGLRVDMDALPLQEQTGLPFASAVDGVMHACGHDGHTAIGLGVASVLARLLPEREGSVFFFFQPGEEFPGGARRMIEEGALDGALPEWIVAMHLFPDLPQGIIGLRYGIMTAAEAEITVVLRGRGGHAAYPHRCADPFPAAAAFIQALQGIVSRSADPLEPLVISLGEIRGGSGHNTIPEEITIKGTARSLTRENQALVRRRMEEILEGLERSYRVQCSLLMEEAVPLLACDEESTAAAEAALVEMYGRESVVRIGRPSLGVDDFAFFAQKIPATYLRLGCGDPTRGYIHPLHHNRFDFGEKLLARGVEAVSAILLNRLESKVFG